MKVLFFNIVRKDSPKFILGNIWTTNLEEFFHLISEVGKEDIKRLVEIFVQSYNGGFGYTQKFESLEETIYLEVKEWQP